MTGMGLGTLWDDLGSTTFVTAKNDAETTRPFTYNAKRRESSRRIVESPDDELDFLSSGSRSDDVEQLIPIKSKPGTKKKQPGKAVIQGRTVDYHPDHLPKKKLPDFKKITTPVPEEGRSSTPRRKTYKATQKALKQSKSYGMLATLHNNENERLSELSDGSSSDNGPLTDDHDSSHANTPRGCTNGTVSCRPSKLPHNKASSQSSDINNRSTPTSPHASGIQSLDSDDSSEVTPRAKHLKLKSRPRKFPTLDPLFISDSMVSQPNGGKSKVLLKGATDNVPSQTHRRTLSSMTIPRKYRKSRYPIPSPLSSPVHEPSQDSAIALRETNPRDLLDIANDDDADDESPKRRLQLRPFPMAATQSKATSHTPRRKTTFTQQACPDNDRSNPFSSDLEVLGDDSCQRHHS
ncbi:hypothetical protein BJV74DRAFT_396913 [Russula compacta]|nr:hypothetical protein BJV74DRAFT_396913 [Russula compacta]